MNVLHTTSPRFFVSVNRGNHSCRGVLLHAVYTVHIRYRVTEANIHALYIWHPSVTAVIFITCLTSQLEIHNNLISASRKSLFQANLRAVGVK